MNLRFQISASFARRLAIALLVLATGFGARAEDFAALCAGRSAVERVYYNHRLGGKPPFEQASPPAVIERLVKEDLRKEAALRKVYGIEITPAQLDGEVRRIDTTTRAPETLVEIKAALGHDPGKFARIFAKPFLVERVLRERFENDAKLHAPQREVAEALRGQLAGVPAGFDSRLAALTECGEGEIQELVTWELTPRPATETAVKSPAPPQPTRNQSAAGVYSIEATAQVAQALSSPEKEREAEQKQYFEDLPAALQQVLNAQLRHPGDVGPVIETPVSFQIYLLKERTAASLSAAVFTLRKRGYDEWLEKQPDPSVP